MFSPVGLPVVEHGVVAQKAHDPWLGDPVSGDVALILIAALVGVGTIWISSNTFI